MTADVPRSIPRSSAWQWVLAAAHLALASAVLLPGAVLLVASTSLVPALFLLYDGVLTPMSRLVDVVMVLAISAVVWSLTVLVVAIVGLPIRLVGGVRRWWAGHPLLAPSLIAVGIALQGVAWATGGVTTVRQEGVAYPHYVPQLLLLAPGWFALAFGVTHIWFPRRLSRTAEPDAAH